jgi:N-glycosidase YbiA
MEVLFYSTKERPYGCFSNLSAHPFELNGLLWPTSEHYFQAQKFASRGYAEAIRAVRSPMGAARMGRARSQPIRADWEQIKDDVMRRAVLRKFETHAEIRAVLLATGDEEIVEDAPNDFYWGRGADGTGQNKLGQILMEVRTMLRRHEAERQTAR